MDIESVEHYYQLVDETIWHHPNDPRLVQWVVSSPLPTIFADIVSQMVCEAPFLLTAAASDELQELWTCELQIGLDDVVHERQDLEHFFVEVAHLAPFIKSTPLNCWLIRWHATFKAVCLLAEAIEQLTASSRCPHPINRYVPLYGHD